MDQQIKDKTPEWEFVDVHQLSNRQLRDLVGLLCKQIQVEPAKMKGGIHDGEIFLYSWVDQD